MNCKKVGVGEWVGIACILSANKLLILQKKEQCSSTNTYMHTCPSHHFHMVKLHYAEHRQRIRNLRARDK